MPRWYTLPRTSTSPGWRHLPEAHRVAKLLEAQSTYRRHRKLVTVGSAGPGATAREHPGRSELRDPACTKLGCHGRLPRYCSGYNVAAANENRPQGG